MGNHLATETKLWILHMTGTVPYQTPAALEAMIHHQLCCNHSKLSRESLYTRIYYLEAAQTSHRQVRQEVYSYAVISRFR